MDSPIRALRYAFRRLAKHPTTTIAAIIAMALGIALTASMYSILDGILLRGLPFPEADQLMHLERNNLSRDIDSMEVTQHDFEDWRAQQESFEGIAGFTGGTFNLADEGPPDRYTGAWISTNFLDLVRLDPVLGRGFTAADEQPDAAPVILLGHQVWQKRYGGDPDVLGRVIRVNTEPATVVGVLPEGFRFPIDHDVWMPLVLETATLQRGEGTTLEVFGRLRDGITLDRAAAEMATIAARLAQQYPELNEGVNAVVKPYIHEFIGRETRLMLGVMFTAVLLVLLIACFNVANLLLGRASLRSRELAIRSALGSKRWQAIGQVLSEAVLVALTGAAIGIGLAHFAVRAFVNAIAQTDPPFWFDIAINGRVLLFVLAISALSALIAGLLPALQASRPNLSQVLQDTNRGSTSFRLGLVTRSLVVLEVAFSCALLVGAGLMVRSVLAVNGYQLRFEPDNVLTARIGLFEGDYPEDTDKAAFFEAVQERVAARSEVVTATIATTIPTDVEIGAGGNRYQRPDETYDHPRDMPWARLTTVSPGYFEAFEVPILAGRDFTAGDREGAPKVAIVNQGFADLEWPGESPIGRRVNLWLGEEEEAADPQAGWVEVVGLVPDLRFADFDNDDDQQGVYLPVAQNPPQFAWIVAKTRTDPLSFVEPLRRTVLEQDANLPLYFVRSMDQVLERTMFFPNLFGVLFSIFGAVAVVLACVGLYGVMAFGVAQRIQEMGVRRAFGARTRDVFALILRQGLRQVSIGLALGLALAAGIAAALGAFLFQIKPADPVTFTAVPALLLVVALLACLVPARRAAAVDPMVALRYE